MGKYSNVENPLSLLGSPARMLVGGRMLTVKLTDWEEADQTYYGSSETNRSLDNDVELPQVKSLTGLRPYPYAARPDYAFQFVAPGEDESVLLAIGQGNATPPVPPVEVVVDDADTADLPEQTEETFADADLNRDGTVTKQERKQWKREQ